VHSGQSHNLSKAYNTTNQSEHKVNGNGKMYDLIEKFLIE